MFEVRKPNFTTLVVLGLTVGDRDHFVGQVLAPAGVLHAAERDPEPAAKLRLDVVLHLAPRRGGEQRQQRPPSGPVQRGDRARQGGVIGAKAVTHWLMQCASSITHKGGRLRNKRITDGLRSCSGPMYRM